MKKISLLFVGFAALLMIPFAVHAEGTSIADRFETSFVEAIENRYGITADEFTDEWAAAQKSLDLANMNIGGIDKGGVDAHVLTDYFTNLEELNISGNQLGGLPNLPSTLKVLNVADNQITALPNLTPILTDLDISGNQIRELTTLPETLVYFDASNNPLAALITLPAGLEELYVSNCGLSALITLPESLKVLDASENELPGLPPLPANLETLNVSNNALTALPDLAPTITILDLSNNQLTELPILPENLITLNIKGNKIEQVLASQLPDSLVNFESDVEVTDDIASDSTEIVENPETSDTVLLFVSVAFISLVVSVFSYKKLHN